MIRNLLKLGVSIPILCFLLSQNVLAAKLPVHDKGKPVPEKVFEPLSDPEIANIIVNINNSEIKYGLLARKKAVDKDVHAFAEEMLDEHSQQNVDIGRLRRNIKLLIETTDISDEMKKTTEAKVKVLEASKHFDSEYIDSQVLTHSANLRLLSERLIPQAKNPRLLALLEKIKDMVKRHLMDALKVQNALKYQND